MKKNYLFILAFMVGFGFSCNDDSDSGPSEDNTPAPGTIPAISYAVVNTFPHDTSSFTEGLEFYNGNLLESTGNYGKSKLLLYNLQSGKVLKELSLEPKYFGEGVTVLHDTIYQLTYQEKVVLLYSAKDFKKIKELPIASNEGWGMTNNGKQIIASDGTSNLFFYEPGTFKLIRAQEVTENGTPVVNINELEYINGYVYANQWQYSYIIKIDPTSGNVVAKMDLTDLVNRVKTKIPNMEQTGAYINGIARDPQTGKIYITGKFWPQIFEVDFPH